MTPSLLHPPQPLNVKATSLTLGLKNLLENVRLTKSYKLAASFTTKPPFILFFKHCEQIQYINFISSIIIYYPSFLSIFLDDLEILPDSRFSLPIQIPN